MSELTVKIVTLEPMRMASAYGFGDEPEGTAWDKMMAYAEKHNLVGDGFRTFGFNNPNPSPGSPNYGYELWTPVTKDTQPEGDIRIVDFGGGLYAVTEFKGLENIGGMWKELVKWREASQYRPGNHQWLEELLTAPDVPIEEYVFRLYLPVVK